MCYDMLLGIIYLFIYLFNLVCLCTFLVLKDIMGFLLVGNTLIVVEGDRYTFHVSLVYNLLLICLN